MTDYRPLTDDEVQQAHIRPYEWNHVGALVNGRIAFVCLCHRGFSFVEQDYRRVLDCPQCGRKYRLRLEVLEP